MKIAKTQDELISTHPCYCKNAAKKYSRMHIPVAPKCNIACNYCNRKFDCVNESRPGVTSEVLTPEEALIKVVEAKMQDPNLTVIGIAGPGDALSNPEATFYTFKLIKKYDPELQLCMSTNGLGIEENVQSIISADIKHVTVTLNAVDPEIAKSIYSKVKYNGKTYYGVEGAHLLLEKQLTGIKLLVENDILVKVNTVLIPAYNKMHIDAIAQTIKKLGVFIHNIIPLIVNENIATKFSRLGITPPSKYEIMESRKKSADIMGGYDHVMSHCKQCRADALGKLAEHTTTFHLATSKEAKEISQKIIGGLS